MAPIWRIEMFGTLRALHGDGGLTRFRTRRVAILLAYLSFFQDREHSREDLAEMLWPDQEEEVMRRNLRQALHSLRKTLEPPPLPTGSVLKTENARVYLDRSLLTTDVQQFERLMARARRLPDSAAQSLAYREAIQLYHGELLPGFHAEWILRERLRVEDLYVSGLRKLIAICKRENRPEDSILFLRRAIAQEPLQEDWHAELMEQYLMVGRPASALKQFQELKDLLMSQLGCAPSDRSSAIELDARRALPTPRVPKGKQALPSQSEVSLGSAKDESPTEELSIVRLPIQITRFYGRQAEIATVSRMFSDREAQLVTLLGPAGTGKTRLATEIGRVLAEKHHWNVWFVSLADLADASMLLDRVVDVMQARQANIPDLIDQIGTRLEGQNNVLILDNLEHILEKAVDVVGRIVGQLPDLRVLTTSRQSMRLSYEREFRVDPLPVPPPTPKENLLSREELARLAEFPSVQIFLDRSRLIRPDVQLTASNAGAIAAICSKLEGIPLAIELAAGQINTIAPAQMLRHLDRRLMALSTRRRDAAPRHRSLRAAIDYSFESLTPELQRLFMGLSVFRGGFTVASAIEVSVSWIQHSTEGSESGSSRINDAEFVLESIIELQERSLLRPESTGNSLDPRFRMLESFRQFGEEQLSEAELHGLRTSHANYFLTHFGDLPEEASAEAHTHLHLRIDAEYDNFIAALEFLFQERQYESSIRLLAVVAKTWLHRGPRVIEREYIRQISILARDLPVDPALQIRLLRMLGTTHIRASDYAAAYKVMQSAVEVALRYGDKDQIATCYSGLSTCAGFLGQMNECYELNLQALECVSKKNFELIQRIYLAIGAVHWSDARLEQALAAFTQAREASERARGGEPDALVLYNLARTHLDLGQSDEALAIVSDAIRICQKLSDPYALSQCLYLVARYHWQRGDFAAAIATNHQALVQGQETAFGFLSLYGVRNHALILCRTKEWETASMLLAATQSLSKMHRKLDDLDYSEARDLCKTHLTKQAFETAWAKGLGMSGEDALKVALENK